jgi:flagellar protein FlaG
MMELPNTKGAAGVSASPTATGRHSAVAVAVQEVVPPVQQVQETRPPSQNLQHTQQAIAEQVSRYLNSSTRNLEFQVDSESGTAVIVVRDVQGNVIRRIPGEEALQRMLRASSESGTIIDSTA